MLIIMNKTIIIIRMRAVGALETVPLRLTFNFKQIGLDVPEICIVGNCLDTEKTTEDVKKRHGFDWFLLAIFSLPKLMYDCLNYLELCHVYNNNINNQFTYYLLNSFNNLIEVQFCPLFSSGGGAVQQDAFLRK